MVQANPDAPAPREFYDQAVRHLGDPAHDLPLTVRVKGGEDRAARYSADTVRAVRTASVSQFPWVIVAGPGIGGWRSDHQVRDWPVVHAVVNEAAFGLARGAAPTPARPAELDGDMGVEAFRG